MTLPLYRLQPAGNLVIRNPDWTWLRSDVAALVRGAALRSGAAVKILDGSKEGGGKFKDHKSHRAGADLDIRGLEKGKPGEDPEILKFLQVLGPGLEKIGSTYPLNITGVKVRPWPGHTGHVHARFPQRPVSARVLGAVTKVRANPKSNQAVTELARIADVGLMAIEGHDQPGASMIAKALAVAYLTDAKVDPVGAALDGVKAAAALRALALFLGDWDTSTMETASEPWLYVTPTEAVQEAAKLAVSGLAAGLGFAGTALAPLLIPLVAAFVVVAIVVAAVLYFIRRDPSPSSTKTLKATSAPASFDDLALPELRSAHAKFVSPPGRRNRANLIANLESKGVTEAQVKAWMKGR